jgi:CubicO group peptidase (beta-lactamase class C family)
MDWRTRLDEARAQTGVTGASFAYWDGEALHTAVSGVRNSVTGDPVTADTIMHIGSITKVFNACLLMQLVDDGLIRLEDPVLKHLPDLKLADMDALARMTCQMLVNHTSGIDCSVLPDHGPDQERIADAIARFAELGQLHAPGEATCYNNAATVIAGYLTQTLRQESWYSLVKSRIFEPLGMAHAMADLTDLPRFRCSVGDITNPETGDLVQTTRPYLCLSFAPAGATLMMTAEDLVTFGRAMITGVGPNGVRILSAESARRMAQPTAAFVNPPGAQVGLGWLLIPGGVAWHAGGGPGVFSLLYVHADSGRVLALLTNCDRGRMLAPAVIEPILDSWTGRSQGWGMGAPENAQAGPEPFEPALYEGVYEMSPHRAEVRAKDGALAIRLGETFSVYDSSQATEDAPATMFEFVGGHRFKPADPSYPFGAIEFIPGPDGRMKFCGMLPLNLMARVA